MADPLSALADRWADSGRTAVVDGAVRLTHAELHRRAGAVAAALGDVRGATVGVLLPRGADFVVAVLGVLKAGGAYVPLDPAYPSSRLDLMTRVAGCRVTVTTAAHAGRTASDVVLVETVPDGTGPQVDVSGEDLAYVMFTSGSTGVPKGVRVPRRAVAGVVRGPDVVPTGPDDVVLWVSSPSFDGSTFDLWATLGNGARLVVAPTDATAVRIGELVRTEGVTTVLFPTGLFHLMVDECLDDLGGLRTVLVGGDVLSAVHCARFLAAAPSCRLFNIYGPTETTVYVAKHEVPADIAGTVPIGSAAAGAVLRVLDEDMRDAVEGQLHIGGTGLSHGYQGDPELTATRFVVVDGQPMYASGDRVRRRADGVLEFVRRLDDQVKKRGFRVEPAEVEAALRTDPAVADAAVVLTGDTADTRRLVAFVVPRGDAVVEDVRRRLDLPAYLVPDSWRTVGRLPLTGNGKVDRTALAELAAFDRAGGGDHGASGDDGVAAVISGIWREVLDLPEIGPDDDFFELGGHSLLANRVIARIRRRYGVSLSMTVLFDHSTVAALADVVRDAVVGQAAPA